MAQTNGAGAVLQGLVRGAAAGAAGTTALNAVTYLDMAVRGRPTSNTPELTVEKLAQAAHVTILGEGEKRENRLAGLGPLSGLAPGIGVGALLGAGYAARRTPRPVAGTLLCSIVVLLSANAPMTLLGITDPRTWSAADWASDIVPHLAYGATVHGVLASYDN